MLLNGAQIVLKCLKEQEANIIFGYPGGAVIPLYDALYDELDYFTHIRTAHEQAAVHAADGYARSTGKVGVCFVTSGPGATNTITGIATAYMDSIPIVVITGQVARSLLGRDSFQEIDIMGITLSITKHSCIVKDEKELAGTIREAFEIAKSGRPGPVLIDIPKDIFLSETEYEKIDKEGKVQKPTINIEMEKIQEAVKMIQDSKKPIIYAGGGIKTANASKKFCEFALLCDIPVANTLMGLGTIPRDHKLSLGMVGMHGFRETNLAVTRSDLIITIGARFSDRVIGKADEFAPTAKIIQIDIDETEIDKNKSIDLSLVGDMNTILEDLISNMDQKDRKAWHEEIENLKVTNNTNIKQNSFTHVDVLKCLNGALEEDTIVTTDVGQHQMWTAQMWKFKYPRTFITSGGLGTMGFGLGAAIGSQMGNLDKRVLLVTGDGSFRMSCNELQTISKYKLPIITLIMNNHTLGMVRQWQRMFSNGRYSETDIGDEVNYVKLAQAYGIEAYRVTSRDQLKNVLEIVTKEKRPMLIDCVIDKEEGVYPIVPPGKSIKELVLE
ncbi:biosynthetic-type acetolactate synthase large subunit [Clostridium estertheticum]|uniref:Acetolactate synthase n=1 Tax=Clostridium estertheticum TaxID=238834 RepID=A0AA47EL83_9CLOT|nr:biosynthetic-type acetolactate synthase large subunit [Clostridium estertheticum]MBU3156004.1 biosynthetic-type acetolactate synthase large subunit [Clostridium estertheticum]MBU3201536.1 biosynthetic-type acetolactate synthase large subunit [Clostridium estertheticum]WAG60663.1 biosynthetic-type acetolactate synthase large subunit [Clostridium estertheticum]WAG65246.1 biosynthetic-type acetolactate synthase large subunit [Clostridium estertheticum]